MTNQYKHIKEFSSKELEDFITEDMEKTELEFWQEHYNKCKECHEYVSESEVDKKWAEIGEKAYVDIALLLGLACDAQSAVSTLQKAMKKPEPEKVKNTWDQDPVKNLLLQAQTFLKQWKEPILGLPLQTASAATNYQRNETYAIIPLGFPLPSEGGITKQVKLECHCSFSWTKKELWGNIELKMSDKNLYPSDEGVKDFFSKLLVDLYVGNKILRGKVSVTEHGTFPISKEILEIEEIKKLLSEKSLSVRIGTSSYTKEEIK